MLPGDHVFQIGQTDILRLMTDAREQQGAAFRLQAFHHFVWANGNLPFSPQRWEVLGDRSDVPPVAASFAWTGR